MPRYASKTSNIVASVYFYINNKLYFKIQNILCRNSLQLNFNRFNIFLKIACIAHPKNTMLANFSILFTNGLFLDIYISIDIVV